MKYWEIIADKLKKGGFNLGWVSALDPEGRTIWTVDAHRDGKRFVVRASRPVRAASEKGILLPVSRRFDYRRATPEHEWRCINSAFAYA